MSFENKSIHSSSEPSLKSPVQIDSATDQGVVNDGTSRKDDFCDEPHFNKFPEPSLQDLNHEEVVDNIHDKVSKILKLVENPQKAKSSKFWIFLAISQIPFSITTIMDNSPAFKDFFENYASDIIDTVSSWIN